MGEGLGGLFLRELRGQHINLSPFNVGLDAKVVEDGHIQRKEDALVQVVGELILEGHGFVLTVLNDNGIVQLDAFDRFNGHVLGDGVRNGGLSVLRIARPNAVRTRDSGHARRTCQVQSQISICHLQFSCSHVWKRTERKCHSRVCCERQHGGFQQIVCWRSYVQLVCIVSRQLEQLGECEFGQGHPILSAYDGALVCRLLGQNIIQVTFRCSAGIDQLLNPVNLTPSGLCIQFRNREKFLLEQDVEVARSQVQCHIVLGNLHIGLGKFESQPCPPKVQMVLKSVEQGQTRAHAVIA